MANVKRLGSVAQVMECDIWDEGGAVDAVDDEPLDTYEMFRVTCPDCAQPIALLDGEGQLPGHARLVTPWNPFDLTVCEGSGRALAQVEAWGDVPEEREDRAAVVLTLPEELDWRRQPFSHAGGPGSQPIRFHIPAMRNAGGPRSPGRPVLREAA
ncbi:hypothetical protein ACFQLX_23510 [Streptomyces polyrhachis]|uniref:Uncharacterized protein n=1 Tax=Streptomyces polyrhachis TaxID=1282885 RepID=A0ABW2GNC9_9ACTN